MMPGGQKEAYEAVQTILEKVAAQVDDGPCVTYIGPGGAGNFVKQARSGSRPNFQFIVVERAQTSLT